MTWADGTLVVSGELAVIAFERRLRHPVAAVWKALTDSEELAAWLGSGGLEPHESGQVSIRTGPADRPDPRGTISGRVLAWDPPRVLEHEWLQRAAVHQHVHTRKDTAAQCAVRPQTQILNPLKQDLRIIQIEEILRVVIDVLRLVVVKLPPGANFADRKSLVAQNPDGELKTRYILLNQRLAVPFHNQGRGSHQGLAGADDAGIHAAARANRLDHSRKTHIRQRPGQVRLVDDFKRRRRDACANEPAFGFRFVHGQPGRDGIAAAIG